ncbi:MAG TPA: hypothetical protein VL088_02410, partial [Pedobacter sp.]|nr:hypothetical protein [Pedobacter sp.]
MEDFKLSPAIESVIAELEIQRKKIASNKFQGWGAILLGLVIVFIVLSIGQAIVALVIGAALIIPGIVILYRISDDIAQYKYRFKQEV